MAYKNHKHISQFWNLKVWDWGPSMNGWGPSSGVDFSVYPHMAEGARKLYRISLRALIPFKRVPSSWLHLPKAWSNTIILGIRNPTCEFWVAGSPKHSEDWFSSVTQSCPTLCNPMNRSTPCFPVHHQLPEFTQTHVHWVGDAIQPSHPLSCPSSPAPNHCQHQGLFQ